MSMGSYNSSYEYCSTLAVGCFRSFGTPRNGRQSGNEGISIVSSYPRQKKIVPCISEQWLILHWVSVIFKADNSKPSLQTVKQWMYQKCKGSCDHQWV